MHRPLLHGLVLVIIFIAVGYATVTGGTFRGRSHAFAAPVMGLSLPGVSSSIPPVEQSVVKPLTINRTLRAEQPIGQVQQQAAAEVRASYATPTATSTVVAAPQEDAVVRAASVAPPPVVAAYQVYQVQDGDTVSSIAAKFGVKTQYVLANNAEIRDSDFLKLGQSIIVPAGDGILHEVRYGETLSDIATKFDVDVTAITGFAGNAISTPDDIKERQTVYIPGGRVEAPAPAAAPLSPTANASGTPTPAGDLVSSAGSSSGSSSSSSSVDTTKSSSGLIWPVHGPISSYYGPSHPLGIDIDGYNLAGHAIAAATSGTVIFAGGNACCSYGLYVVVMSPGGIETLYGHLSSINVSQGQTVSQGDELGIIGNTGYSTGTHLHFEVIDNGTRENPTAYLP